MSSKKPNPDQTKARAKKAASGTAVRDRVRDLSVSAFRDLDLSLSDLSKLVQEVLEGAVEAVDKSIPASRANVLREVFDGLSEGVQAIASSGSAALSDARKRGEAITAKPVANSAKRMRDANTEFLGTVKNFAGKTSKQVRDELNALVKEAEKLGPKVAGSAQKAASASKGRLMELTGETARAGVRVARRTAGGVVMAAGGFLEGLAEALAPKDLPQAEKKHATKRAGAKRVAVKKKPEKTKWVSKK
ncbi:MAG: hypothetical protein C0483_25345 [Pirellula sp.]|nr:hypothetical protein [Pirellula sp.]